MIVLVGASSSGKSSIKKQMVSKYDYKDIVTYTTRQPRFGEIDGVDYHFITVDKFKELESTGFFAEVGVYNNWFYGSAKEDYVNDGIIILTPSGLRQVKKHKELDITSFYIDVPRRDRLIKILQRGDQIDEAYRRNVSDVGMFDGVENEVDYVIKNEGYNKSVIDITDEIISLLNN